jgi:hypothetical protein
MTDVQLKQLRKMKKEANLNIRVPKETKELILKIVDEKDTTISKLVENFFYTLIRRSGRKTKV